MKHVDNDNYEIVSKTDDGLVQRESPLKRILTDKEPVDDSFKRDDSPYNYKDPKTKMHFVNYPHEKDL